jgi:hypothetical protein
MKYVVPITEQTPVTEHLMDNQPTIYTTLQCFPISGLWIAAWIVWQMF